MKYLFLNIPAYGHVNPTLAVVKELIERGNEVFYYNTNHFRENIESTGAKFFSYNEAFYPIFSSRNATDFTSVLKTILDMTKAILPDLLVEIKRFQPDCIIYDSLCLWGKILGYQLNIPSISSITTLILTSNTIGKFSTDKSFENKLKDLKMELDALTDCKIDTKIHRIVMNTDKLNITYTSTTLHPRSEILLEEYKFVGTSILEKRDGQIDWDIPRNKPLIYISFGTMLNNNISFFKDCFNAFRNMDVNVVLSVGKNTDIRLLGAIPPNFIVCDFVPQLDILTISDVFITHAGPNSVNEALYYQVPLVLIPQQWEQKALTRRVVECGAGIEIEEVNAENLKKAVEIILSNATYREAAKKQSELLIGAGGYKKAADIMENYAKSL